MNSWQFNNTLLSDEWVIEEIMKEKYLNEIKMQTQNMETYEIQ